MGERKQRSDKKREVQPTVGIELKDMIYRLSYVTRTPVKDICEFMCVYLMNDEKVINALSVYFRRDIRIGSTLFRGSLDNVSITKRFNKYTERITVRFKQKDYERISMLSYALDCSVSRVVSLLLELSINNMKVVNIYIKNYLSHQLTPSQMKELRNILKEANDEKEDNSSWLSLLMVMMNEVTTPIIKIKDAVSEFLVNIRIDDE